jgi:hypothetical protein
MDTGTVTEITTLIAAVTGSLLAINGTITMIIRYLERRSLHQRRRHGHD